MAHFGAPPSSFGAPPSYGGYPGAPGLGPAPSNSGAPGMSPPPGFNAQSPVNGTGGFNPSNFQLPAGINPNASVIRLGGQAGKPGLGMGRDNMMGNRGRMGLGADSGGGRPRDNNLQPLTKEEVSRTVYVGGLVDGAPNDTVLEEILNIGRGLRRWSRVTDVDGKPCDFGFAEYEDAASLEIATKLFEDLEVPSKKQIDLQKLVKKEEMSDPVKKEEDQDPVKKEEDETESTKSPELEDVKPVRLIVIVDPASLDYIKQWTSPDSQDLQFKLDSAQEDLRSFLLSYKNGTLNISDDFGMNGDTSMMDAQAAAQAELLELPNADDELFDIPADQREMVATEIAAFRHRSNKRDMERLKMEEEVEKSERERFRSGRANRLASPPPAAPAATAGPNGVPLGPRGAVPTGPKAGKAFRGLQIPKDHVEGIRFVNGDKYTEESDSESDAELERRRQAARDEELDKEFTEEERRWLSYEKRHFAAMDRQAQEDRRAAERLSKNKDRLREVMSKFDDEGGIGRRHLFYTDRRAWRSQRRPYRDEERDADRRDRDHERREEERRQRRLNPPRERREEETPEEIYQRRARLSSAQENKGFSVNLGFSGFGAARNDAADDEQDAKPTNAKTMADMENLLDDAADEDGDGDAPKLKGPVEFKPLAAGEKMTEEQRNKASSELARSLPNDAENLFKWNVKWDSLPEKVISEQLRPYVQKKIMEALGVQEDLLVSSIEGIIKRHGSAEDVMHELEETLDDEAEMVTRRVWKMVVFWSESGARGLIV